MSLSSQPSTSATGRPAPTAVCATCAEALAEINMVIDGKPLTMRSCSHCDTRSWHRGDEAVDLGGVLADISSRPTRYKRDLTV